MLGIVADVNLLEKEDKQYIEISVEPSAIPISLKRGLSLSEWFNQTSSQWCIAASVPYAKDGQDLG